jgi:hypothetical protein
MTFVFSGVPPDNTCPSASQTLVRIPIIGVTITCGDRLRHIARAKTARFAASGTFTMTIAGAMLDYFLNAFESSPLPDRDAYLLTFRYCREANKCTFSFNYGYHLNIN